MSYKVPSFSVRGAVASLWRPLLAAVLMAEAMWVVVHDAPDEHGWQVVPELLVGGLVGLVVYVAVLLVLRVPEMSGLARRLPGGRRAPAATST